MRAYTYTHAHAYEWRSKTKSFSDSSSTLVKPKTFLARLLTGAAGDAVAEGGVSWGSVILPFPKAVLCEREAEKPQI